VKPAVAPKAQSKKQNSVPSMSRRFPFMSASHGIHFKSATRFAWSSFHQNLTLVSF